VSLNTPRRARFRLRERDIETADADLAQAFERVPHDRIVDRLKHRTADALAEGRPADAPRLLDRVAAVRPGDLPEQRPRDHFSE
jgi:hypothetical protein